MLSKKEKLNNISFLLSLLASAVDGGNLPEVTENIDFQFIFQFAKIHKVANTAFYAVENLSNKPCQKLYREWENFRNKELHKNMIQATEFNCLTKIFQANSIPFLPLKGFDLCKLYPAQDYRAMSDLDIMVEDIPSAVKLLKDMGYIIGKKDATHEKSLSKPPFTIVELHRELININSPHYGYYKDFFRNCKGQGCYKKMSDEDFYIYNLVHLYKHYTISGCGIRNILDLHLLDTKLLPKLNKNYINRELKVLKLEDFEKEMLQISRKWFKEQDFSAFSKSELYILSSGAYGTMTHLSQNEKQGKSKAKYIFAKIFPSLKWMQNFYLPLRKHPYLLPFFYIYRILKAPFR